MEIGPFLTWKSAKTRVFDFVFGTWTLGVAQYKLAISHPAPCRMCTASGKYAEYDHTKQYSRINVDVAAHFEIFLMLTIRASPNT